MGSDWSVSTANPLLEMEIAVDRVDRRLDARRAPSRSCPTSGSTSSMRWRAFTIGSAYVNHLDDETGTLEVGKLADLVVLDRDLFDRGAGTIGDARVVATFVEGVAVFEDPALDGLMAGCCAARPRRPARGMDG